MVARPSKHTAVAPLSLLQMSYASIWSRRVWQSSRCDPQWHALATRHVTLSDDFVSRSLATSASASAATSPRGATEKRSAWSALRVLTSDLLFACERPWLPPNDSQIDVKAHLQSLKHRVPLMVVVQCLSSPWSPWPAAFLCASTCPNAHESRKLHSSANSKTPIKCANESQPSWSISSHVLHLTVCFHGAGVTVIPPGTGLASRLDLSKASSSGHGVSTDVEPP